MRTKYHFGKIKPLKAILLLTACYLIPITLCGQTPSWLWAKSAGKKGNDGAYSIATDPSGYVYMAGYFSSPTISFGSTTLTNHDTISGYSDLFLVKYDSSGNVLWAKSAGGSNEDYAMSISSDTSGHLYVIGGFASASITFGTTTLTNSGTFNNMFVVKYDTSGTVLWAKKTGGDNDVYATHVICDAFGNSYVSGYFYSSSITFGTTILNNTGITDVFIVKYDSTGSATWAKSASGSGYDFAVSVTVSDSNSIYLVGDFESPTITFGSVALVNSGNSNIFISKYNSNGSLIWAKSAGGNDFDYADDVASDSSGNICLVGNFSSPTIAFGSTTLTIINPPDIFIAKYDSSGTALWARSAGGNDNDYATSVAVDAIGNFYVIGDFASSSINFDFTTLTNVGIFNMFIVKYDTSGTVSWAKGVGGNNVDHVAALAINEFGDIYFSGWFYSRTAPFGPYNLTNFDTTNNSSDIFLAKLSDTPLGLENLNGSNNIVVFPNPMSDNITLSYSLDSASEIEISIYDNLGRVIYAQTKRKLSPGMHMENINTQFFANGFYYVKFFVNKFEYVRKLVKQ